MRLQGLNADTLEYPLHTSRHQNSRRDTHFMNSECRIFLSHIMYDAEWGFVTLLQWRARTGAGRLDGVGGAKKTNVAPKLGAGVAPAYSRSAVQGFHLYDAIISLGFRFLD
jgi:hypothetical protein